MAPSRSTTITLWGLKSRWMMPLAWAAARASASGANTAIASRVDSGPRDTRRCASDWPGTSSMT